MSDTLYKVIAALEAVTDKKASKSGAGFRTVCPLHGHKDQNLYIADGNDRLIIHCHSHGCDPKDIIEATGLMIKDVFYKSLNPQQQVQHKIMVNDRQVKQDLEIELLILLQWLSAFYSDLFPEQPSDKTRVLLAMQRIKKVMRHYIEIGI